MAPHILGDYKSTNGDTHVTIHPSGNASVSVAGKAVPNVHSRGNVVHWDNTGLHCTVKCLSLLYACIVCTPQAYYTVGQCMAELKQKEFNRKILH